MIRPFLGRAELPGTFQHRCQEFGVQGGIPLSFKLGQFCSEMLACSGTFCKFRQFPMVPAKYNTPITSATADEARP
jgi:hypothetical protein